ncbi:M20/M25/M40 family metallo-hydrolase [Flavobacteriaceae bacterium]|nr:M20/M25/M40 family metallo-hydrolase [Flavobacteriaceae bacterium]MDB4591338.1 M20/M25/M40 family metallo-hydrolase [Flavobacteriaceae bacterium]
MKSLQSLASFLLIVGLVYYSFFSLMPQKGSPSSVAETKFSTERALIPLKEITKAPHYIGTKEHARVRNYLIGQLEELGLETQVQQGFVINPKWKSLDKPKNIIAKIQGSENGKSLLLLSHYDSALTPSYGASDAGSGVVTILETLRAYKASGKKPKNDIIVLFTDAEEVGLDGARLFVNNHPWAKNVGIALNFEARGSGGPSNMIVETNGGNKNLIKAFMAADVKFPVASSLMYSIYKMLPNDTDSTVLREGADIDGFFFAFIDDHYDYHTANDTYDNLDVNTLQHQGEYLLPLVHYFGDSDLNQLKSLDDHVYINLPFFKMVSYPFTWVFPMLLVAIIIFIVLIIYGLRKRVLTGNGVVRGFIPFTLAMIFCGILGFYGWKLILLMYPQYQEIQHGFTYNGHAYISFFVLLSLGVLFGVYYKFSKKINVANLLVAPLIFWVLINIGVAIYLKGAAFFIIPVFLGLLSLWILIRKDRPNLILLTIIGSIAIFIFAPLVQFFPVGLGLKMLVGSCLFTALLFGILLPVIGFYKFKKILAMLFVMVASLFFIKAHLSSNFSPNRQKPNSLVYYHDADSNKNYWATYDQELDDWTKEYLGDSPEPASNYISYASGSKYAKGYKFANVAPNKNIPIFKTVLHKDTVINQYKEVSFTIFPQRAVNQISLYTADEANFKSLSFNGQFFPLNNNLKNTAQKIKSKELVRYYVSDKDSLVVSYQVSKNQNVSFTVLEYSYDLLNHPEFTINKRADYMMPKPFIVTDAIIVKKELNSGNLSTIN